MYYRESIAVSCEENLRFDKAVQLGQKVDLILQGSSAGVADLRRAFRFTVTSFTGLYLIINIGETTGYRAPTSIYIFIRSSLHTIFSFYRYDDFFALRGVAYIMQNWRCRIHDILLEEN
jgi:hypothetical protein